MAKFCSECGKEIDAGVSFCSECGKAVNENVMPETEGNTSLENTPAVNTVEEQPEEVKQPDTSLQPVTVQPADVTPASADTTVGMGVYFGLIVLFAIPVIGLIACIIMCFAAKNKSIKNYARAKLIWLIIGIVVCAILFAITYIAINTLTDYIKQITNGQFGDILDFIKQFGEMKDSLDGLGNITDQIQNNIPAS